MKMTRLTKLRTSLEVGQQLWNLSRICHPTTNPHNLVFTLRFLPAVQHLPAGGSRVARRRPEFMLEQSEYTEQSERWTAPIAHIPARHIAPQGLRVAPARLGGCHATHCSCRACHATCSRRQHESHVPVCGGRWRWVRRPSGVFTTYGEPTSYCRRWVTFEVSLILCGFNQPYSRSIKRTLFYYKDGLFGVYLPLFWMYLLRGYTFHTYPMCWVFTNPGIYNS